MKKNQFAEIKKMDLKALIEKARATKKEIGHKTLDKNMSKLSNLKEVKGMRHDLAQVLTVIKQKQLLESLEVKDGAKE